MLKKLIKKFLSQNILFQLEKRHFHKHLDENLKKIIKSLSKGDICIDCGANIGIATSLFASYDCEVYSFEPEPYAFKQLENRFNKIKNVRVYNTAVGLSEGKSYLYQHNDYKSDPLKFSEAGSLISTKPNLSSKYIEVRVLDFKRFISKIDNIKILKIDIEGYEVELIPELIKFNKLDNVENVFLELHSSKWPALKTKTDNMLRLIKENNLENKFYLDWP